jgi:aspartate/methionine/tyrosine aminotransferase
LREVIAGKLHTENNIIADPAQEIIVTPGGKQAIFYACMALLNAGDEVLIPGPYWVSYKAMVELADGALKEVPTDEKNDFHVLSGDIERSITDKTKMLILVNPSNPTGAVMSADELSDIARIATRRNLIVIVDEIYEKIVFDGKKHVSLASLPGMKERTITVNGFSKTFAMTGWRLGYAVGPRPIIKQMVKIQQHSATCAASFVQYAAVQAFSKPVTKEVEHMVRTYESRRNVFIEGIQALPFYACNMPQGAFYFFLNIKKFKKSSMDISKELLETVSLATVPGSAFGNSGEGYVRISFATSDTVLKDALKRFEQFTVHT